MDWHTFRHLLAFWARTRLPWPRTRPHTRPSQPRPRARLGLQRHEERESPTSLGGAALALGQALDVRGWDGAELGAISRVAVMDPAAVTIDSNAGSATVTWWSGNKKAEAGSNTTVAIVGSNSDDSTATVVDDSFFGQLDLSSSTLNPPLGVDPQLSAASGLLTGIGSAGAASNNYAVAGAAGAFFEGAPPSNTPTDRGFVPPLGTTAPGANRSAGGRIEQVAPRPVAAPTVSYTASTTLSPSAGPAKSTGGGIPAPAGPTGDLGANPFIVTHNAADILPQLYASTAADPEMGLVQVPDGAQGQNPMTQGFSAGGVRYADGTVQLSQSDMSSVPLPEMSVTLAA